MRKELARNFVNGFVAQRSIDEPDFSAAEILFKETCQLAGGAGIVRAVEVNVWIGLQFFKAARPDRVGDSLRNVVGGNAETTGGQLTRGGQRVQGILQLEAAGQAGGNFEGFPRRKFGDLRARENELFSRETFEIAPDRKSTRLKSSHVEKSDSGFFLKKKKKQIRTC